jgi:hypothetical protein
MRAVTPAAIGAIMLLATYVRVSHPELSWFSFDQARDSRVAGDIVAGRAFPLMGVEVAGGPAHTWGPAYFYVIAIPFAVSRDPVVAVAFLGALNAVSVLLTYRFGRVFFGPAVAMLAAALISTYPLVVLGAKALWNIAPLPLMAVVFFHSLFSVIVHRRSVMVIPTLAVLGLLVHFHLSATSLAVVLLLGLALFRPSLRPRHLAVGIGCLLALSLPYLAAQCLSRFEDIRAAGTLSTVQFRPRGPLGLMELAVDVLFASPDFVSGLAALHEMWRPDVVLGLHRLEAGALVVGLVFVGLDTIRQSLRRHVLDGPTRSVALVALSFAVPLVMLGVRWDVHPHHFDITYPMPFIAAALVLSRAIDWVGTIAGGRARRGLWAVVTIVVGVTVISQVHFHRQLWRAIEAAGAAIWTPLDLELMPIRYKAELSRILVEQFRAEMDVFRRVHGSRAHDLSEDNHYFFAWKRSAAMPRVAPGPRPSLHYAIVRDEADGAPFHGDRTARAGPYVVAEYEPAIDYSSWLCADDPDHDRGLDRGEGSPGWTAMALPTAGFVAVGEHGAPQPRTWRSPIVTCRCLVSVSDARPRPTLIVASLRGKIPDELRVEDFQLNGAPIVPRRVRAHSTFTERSVDVVFDVGGHLRAGSNELALRLFSRTARFNLDVYEIR